MDKTPPPIYTGKKVFSLSKQQQQQIIELIQRTRQRGTLEKAKFGRAWQAAINIENPRRIDLYNIYEDIMIDGHLTGAIENQRKIETLQKAFKLVDKTGKENNDLKSLFEKRWFKQFMNLALDSLYWGFTIIELGSVIDIEGEKVFEYVKQIPRNHVNPALGVYIKDQSDDWKKGISYKDDVLSKWIIQAGGDGLGLLLKCCPPAISKRNVEAFWDEFAEIFGMPIRVGTTTSRDKGVQQMIANTLEKMGSAAWGLFPQGTSIEMKETTRGDAFEVYDRRIVRADYEMSKAILGQTMTMDNGSSKSQSEVHERALGKIIEADADMIKDLVNDELIPRMIMHGFPLKGYKFAWDEQTEYTPQEQTERDKLVLQYYDVDESYFIEQGYPITGKKKQVGLKREPGDDFFQ